MAGWFYIVACAACSVFIAHLFKVSEKKKLNTMNVLSVNYAAGAFIAFFVSAANGTFIQSAGNLTPGMLGLAGMLGIVFIANFFAYSKSVHHNGVGISVAAMRISLLMPVLLSALWYGERLSALQWLGITLVFFTLYLLLPASFNRGRGISSAKPGILPLVLFFLTGFGDSALKIFEQESPAGFHQSFFMGCVFISSYISGIMYPSKKGQKPVQKQEYIMGIMIGVPNLLTALFLIAALGQLNGAVVYGVVNMLTVIAGTMLGVALWGDRLTKKQIAGLVLSIIAIQLML